MLTLDGLADTASKALQCKALFVLMKEDRGGMSVLAELAGRAASIWRGSGGRAETEARSTPKRAGGVARAGEEGGMWT